MNTKLPDDAYPEAEVVARREALLKRMLTTPPTPLKERKGKRGS